MRGLCQTHARRDGDYLILTQDKRLVEVVNVLKNEAQICQLPRPSQVFDALANQAGARLGVGPPIQDYNGRVVFRLVAGAQQQRADPGAADLILFAEFSSASRSEKSDPGMLLAEDAAS